MFCPLNSSVLRRYNRILIPAVTPHYFNERKYTYLHSEILTTSILPSATMLLCTFYQPYSDHEI